MKTVFSVFKLQKLTQSELKLSSIVEAKLKMVLDYMKYSINGLKTAMMSELEDCFLQLLGQCL